MVEHSSIRLVEEEEIDPVAAKGSVIRLIDRRTGVLVDISDSKGLLNGLVENVAVCEGSNG
jgi:hypothetical protein